MIGLFFGESNFPAEILKKIIKNKIKYKIIDLTKKKNFKKDKNSYSVSIGQFGKILKRSRLDGFLTNLDTNAAKVVSSGSERGKKSIKEAVLAQWREKENLFTPGKKEMQNAFKIVIDEMIASAPTTRQKQLDGTMKEVVQLGGDPFEYKKMLPILQKRFPKLFSEFDINNSYHNKAFRGEIKSKVGVPDNIAKGNINQFTESYLKKQFRNKFRKVDLERKEKLNLQYDDQFMFDLFRSRPDDFRTNKPIQDVDLFLNFLVMYSNLCKCNKLYKKFFLSCGFIS